MMPFVEKIIKSWKNYRFRFVPWIVFNLSGRARETARLVTSTEGDALIPEYQVEQNLLSFLPKLHRAHENGAASLANVNLLKMLRHLGFCVERAPSLIPDCGTGVFVTKGIAKKGSVIALYPGTVYQPFEPILLPSIKNHFIFRCLDGIHIDGKDSGLSKIIFKSLTGRDKMGPMEIADTSWLGCTPLNPWNIGQYVNNNNKEYPCNVAYQECTLSSDFPPSLLSLMPYVSYTPGSPRRIVALVATADIIQGTEVLSSYFTLINSQ